MKRERKLNNKGFTLVELIIVMAIMAILVGAIAPQVVKYVEKARVSKDQQVVETIFTAVQTAIANQGYNTDITVVSLAALESSHGDIYKEVKELLGPGLCTDSLIKEKLKSSDAHSSGLTNIVYVASTGEITVAANTIIVTNK